MATLREKFTEQTHVLTQFLDGYREAGQRVASIKRLAYQGANGDDLSKLQAIAEYATHRFELQCASEDLENKEITHFSAGYYVRHLFKKSERKFVEELSSVLDL